MNKNELLNTAKRQKRDEFYTQLVDIENELRHYGDEFRDKTIFCNCDDPYESNFFKYFAMHFNRLGLKKLIATCYDSSPVAGTQLDLSAFMEEQQKDDKPKRCAHKIVITEVIDENGDGAVDLADVEYLIKNRKNVLTVLEGNGDFRSRECIQLLKESDIVITNPPFSLFREYVAQLMEYNKKFIIIGNQNAITYKEFFPYIRDGKVWLGYGFKGNVAHFINMHYEDYAIAGDHREGMIRVSGVMWFTNIDYKERHEQLTLYKKYTPEEYPTYDDYDAIEVSKTSDIPMDYEGVIGVPITFMNKYCPEQFEIIGLDRYVSDNPHYGRRLCINGKETYARILIRKRVNKNED